MGRQGGSKATAATTGRGRPGAATAGRGRPLVITRDEELLDELLRLAGTAGVEVTVAVDSLAAENDWARAPLVVVGADRVADVARRGLPRRMGVVLVAGPDSDGTAIWPDAEVLNAEHVVVLPDARPWLVTCFAAHGLAPGPRAIARMVAVVAGSEAAAAHELAMALAVAGRRRGLSTLLVGGITSGLGGRGCGSGGGGTQNGRGGGPPGAAPAVGAGATGGSLAVVSLEHPDLVGAAPEAMAAALRAGRRTRDLVVVDLPYGLDEASLLALTCADQAHLVVVADIRACAAATRVAATVRRHCPELALVVRAPGTRGLRPAEVAEALALPLVGVLPANEPLVRPGGTGRPDPGADGGPLTRLSRRLLADLDLRPAGSGATVVDAGSRGRP
jgi:secretion/DNA translocation related CpaE-like protein